VKQLGRTDDGILAADQMEVALRRRAGLGHLGLIDPVALALVSAVIIAISM
jgi:hypothetical protein